MPLVTINDVELWEGNPPADVTFATIGLSETFESLGLTKTFDDLMEEYGGEWKTYIKSGSFIVEDVLEERSQCSFIVVDTTAAFAFSQSMRVEVTDLYGAVLFTGFIDSVEEFLEPGTGMLLHTVECVDNHYLADKRVVAYSAEDTLAGDIVEDLIDEYLVAEGITAGTIEDGPTITETILAYVTVSEAMDELAEQAGFTWWIDRYKQLHFMARGSNVAPWNPTDADMIAESVKVERSSEEYRNRQYVIGGQAATSPQTEYFTGDGQQSTFSLAYPVKEIISIKVNDVAKTVGLRGDTGADWYYAEQQTNINQDAAGDRLTSEDVLEIIYIGLYDVIAVSEDTSAVNDRQAKELTTGYVESVAVMPEVQNHSQAEDVAAAKLEKFAMDGATLAFMTRKEGLEAGQLIEVTMTEHGFAAEEMLIQEVDTFEERGHIWYEIEAVSGPVGDSWQKFFAKLMSSKLGEIKKSASGSQLLIRMLNFAKTWTLLDDPQLFNDIYPDAGRVPDGSIYPSFDESDRVKYCVLYDAGGEVFRKAVTTIEGYEAGTDEIVTVTMIDASEAAGELIEYIGWWGGVAATSGSGTGIELDKQAYYRLKTALEAWQIRKIDTKGWS
ncbi:MAG: hypothetical protein J5I35_11835 [Methanothrix harundinacea]|nr:hypothetical protein [Methanothrix harundinacea]